VQTADAGEPEVGHDDVRLVAGRDLECLLARLGEVDVVAVGAQVDANRAQDLRFVVDDENAAGHAGPCFLETHVLSLSSARLRSLTVFSPKIPRSRPEVCSSTRVRTRATGRPRSVAIRLDCRRALATEMSGSRPDADAVTASTGTVTRVERPFRSRYASTRC